MNVTLKMIGAEWCAPCKRVWPWVREIAQQQSGNVSCSYVSVEDCTDEGVLSVPTLIVARDGRAVGRVTRFSGKASLARGIQRMLEAPQ